MTTKCAADPEFAFCMLYIKIFSPVNLKRPLVFGRESKFCRGVRGSVQDFKVVWRTMIY